LELATVFEGVGADVGVVVGVEEGVAEVVDFELEVVGHVVVESAEFLVAVPQLGVTGEGVFAYFKAHFG
jgi:hypothetical protein